MICRDSFGRMHAMTVVGQHITALQLTGAIYLEPLRERIPCESTPCTQECSLQQPHEKLCRTWCSPQDTIQSPHCDAPQVLLIPNVRSWNIAILPTHQKSLGIGCMGLRRSLARTNALGVDCTASTIWIRAHLIAHKFWLHLHMLQV
jgi:hypothetical protein